MRKILVLCSLLLLAPVFYSGSQEASGITTEEKLFLEISKELQVHPGKYTYFSFNTDTFEIEFNKIPDLTEKGMEAVGKVPGWMRANLTYKLTRLRESDQNRFADLILNSPDERYVDEIGFVIAHSSVKTLTDDDFYPSLLTENARLIYENDQHLDYVQVVDKDDHTTLHYHDSDNQTHVLDPEIYYWFVVHPKLSDELPTYIDPDYNYVTTSPYDRNHGVSPPTGKFWREWLFYENKTDKPLLKEKLEGVYTYYDAIGRINSWVGQSMRFTSDNERPVQPVRIYQKGIGRCGEHQDLRGAAARAALIPATCTLNPAEDHVWNEYYDGRWIHWDGGRENPLMYERNWGKTLSTVWSWRGDGYTWSVTDYYSEGSCNLTGRIMDYKKNIVEGADVLIATESFYDPEQLTMTHWTSTDPDGRFFTTAGDGRNYYVRADGGDLGTDPYGNVVTQMVSASQDDQTYTMEIFLPGEIEVLKFSEMAPSPDPDGRFFLDIDMEVESSLIHGSNLFTGERYDHYFDYGYVDFFITDSSNFQLYEEGKEFSGSHLHERTGSADVNCPIMDDVWYGVISNEFSDLAMKTVNVTITISSIMEMDIESPGENDIFRLGDNVTLSGSSFTPWGMDNITAWFENSGQEFMAVDESRSGDPSFSRWKVELDTRGLEPGEQSIIVQGTDGENELTLRRSIILKDTTPPVVSIEYPLEGSRFLDDDIVTFFGNVTDDHRAVSLEYFFDGNTGDPTAYLEFPENGSWSVVMDLDFYDVGIHTFHFSAKDPSGNSHTASVEFEIIEDDGPEISFFEPGNGSVHMIGEQLVIKGKVNDRTGLQSCHISIDGGSEESILSLLEDGEFEYIMETARYFPGLHTVAINAVDVFENRMTGSIDIVLDGDIPVISMNGSYEDRLVKPETGILIEGSVTDVHGIGNLELVLGRPALSRIDITGTIHAQYFSYNITDEEFLSENDLLISIVATDLAGWESTHEIEITCDITEPSISLFVPEKQDKDDVLSLDLLLNDDTGLSHIRLLLAGEEVYSRGGDLLKGNLHLDLDISSTSTGNRTLEAVLVDLAGRTVRETALIFIYNGTSDQDGDGLPDVWEIRYGLDPFIRNDGTDSDGDGFTDLEEFLGSDKDGRTPDGSDPTKIDSFPVYRSDEKGDGNMEILLVAGILLFVVLILSAAAAFFLSRRRQEAVIAQGPAGPLNPAFRAPPAAINGAAIRPGLPPPTEEIVPPAAPESSYGNTGLPPPPISP